jgi:hypothetical protein
MTREFSLHRSRSHTIVHFHINHLPFTPLHLPTPQTAGHSAAVVRVSAHVRADQSSPDLGFVGFG